jgi:hypothetical protein
MIAPGVGYVFVLANAEGQSPVPPTVLTAMVAAAVWMKFLLDVQWSLPREVRFIGPSQIEILGYRVPWVRCQTRVSNRPPQGVLHSERWELLFGEAIRANSPPAGCGSQGEMQKRKPQLARKQPHESRCPLTTSMFGRCQVGSFASGILSRRFKNSL